MKRTLSFLLLYLLLCQGLYAIPAYPQKVLVNIDGDSCYIQLRGDENCKYALDEEGYTILPSSEGWKYATIDETGAVSISKYSLTLKSNMSKETQMFLQQTPKMIIPSKTSTLFHQAESSNVSFSPAVGSRKALVILMQFLDTKFTKDNNDFQRLFNERGYTEDGAKGSVYDYYQWASYGQLDLTSDVLGPYVAKNKMSYYGGNSGIGGNDKNPYALFSEALEFAVKEVNLSDYDANGDGYVDNIHIIYAGYGEEAGASANAIWAHEMTFRTITIQGMKIDRYSCAPELRGNSGKGISRIGPHCHEIGHALGAMDYYDTDYETGGKYQGTGKWDIMASGSWNNDGISPADFNPYVKVYNFGWTEAKALRLDSVNVVKSSSIKGNIFRVNTGTKDDYFLLENRDQQGFHSSEPGKGLLIFHIGPNLEARSSTNTINSTYPQQCYVVCASSTFTRPTAMVNSYGNINSDGCPYPGTSHNRAFNDSSTPASFTINGKDSGINISGIAYEDENIVFQYTNTNGGDTDEPTTPSDGVYLWGEDFEQLRLPTSWIFTDVEQSGNVEVVTKLSENDTPQSPMADSGNGYAKFKANSQEIIGTYRTKGSLVSPHIKLVEGKDYVLAFSARKYNKVNSRDIITLKLYSENEDTEYELVEKEINSQKFWTRIKVPVPKNCHDFTINILLDIDYGSYMFIDNITILESIETTIHSVYNKTEVQLPIIYNMQGIKSEKFIRGINIIKFSDGSYKKVYIK